MGATHDLGGPHPPTPALPRKDVMERITFVVETFAEAEVIKAQPVEESE